MKASLIEIPAAIRQIGRVKFVILLTLPLAAILFFGCQKALPPSSAGENSPQWEPTEAQPKLPTMKIYLGAETLDAELALTAKQIETGMMFRTNIQDADSMLFLLPVPQRAYFWMKNCPQSISCAYITPDGTITEIHHLEHDDTNSVVSGTDNIQFVLETSDGWFQRHNIGVGTVVRTERGSLADTFLRGNQ